MNGTNVYMIRQACFVKVRVILWLCTRARLGLGVRDMGGWWTNCIFTSLFVQHIR